MDNECTKLEAEEVYIPDEYKFDCDGHAVDVCASTYCTNKIELHFWTPDDKAVIVELTQKEAKELRKELKHALKLIEIAEDY